ncbi:MAG: two-component system response regulator [Planctomycetota bacterium]|nr:MAG: two-component system response regulator [Planctomycetota bacterium]
MSAPQPRLLIVDDEVDTCENLRDILSDLGYLVDVAHDGASALELVKQRGYDVALLDLRMPGMDGLELYRRIKQISAGTVAVVVTAYAASDTAKSVLEAGAWKLVAKPVNIPQIVGLVDEALSSPLVLLVDDDSDLCDSLWDVFREHRFRVHLAHDVLGAKDALNRHEFQVVLLDLKLPGDDGAALLEEIRRSNKKARTLVITGYPAEMEQRVERALTSGAEAVCYKPFNVPVLLETVKRLATRDTAAEQAP